MPKRLGFSTGVLFKSISPTSVQIINNCANLGCRTIEVACTKKTQLFYLSQTLKPSDLLFPFSSKSLHLPTDMRYGNNNETKMVLSVAREIQNKFRFSYMVVHSDLVDDWRVLKESKLPIAIENMNQAFSEVESLLHEQPWTDFVFDVNHWASSGNELVSVPGFLQRFNHRLVGVHLSGFDKYHKPLHETKQDSLIKAISGVDVPITIESVLSEANDMRHEQLYISEALGGIA